MRPFLNLRSRRRVCSHAAVVILSSAGMVLAASSPSGAQTLQYSQTDFVHGFSSSGLIWLYSVPELGGQSVPQYLRQYIDLKTVWYPSFGDLTFDTEWKMLRDSIAAKGGKHVLVAHSMGGMLSRYAYQLTTSLRPNIAGIITVSTPHQGVILADSADKAAAFMLDLDRRVNDALFLMPQTIEKKVLAILNLWYTNPVQPVGYGLWSMLFPNAREDISSASDLVKARALPALETKSLQVRALALSSADSAVPRANIVAHLDNNEFMPLKLAAASQGKTERTVIDEFQSSRRAFNVCKYVYYATIIGIPFGRKCAYAEKMMGRLDETWQRYTSGTEMRQILGWSIPVARNIPSDGVVPNERSVYPSAKKGAFRQMPAVSANHLTVYKTVQGAQTIADAMQQIGMKVATALPSALTVGVGGPAIVPAFATCSFGATVSGGTPPYTISWNMGMTGSYVTFTNSGSSFVLVVTARDAALREGTASISVSVSSAAPACGF